MFSFRGESLGGKSPLTFIFLFSFIFLRAFYLRKAKLFSLTFCLRHMPGITCNLVCFFSKEIDFTPILYQDKIGLAQLDSCPLAERRKKRNGGTAAIAQLDSCIKNKLEMNGEGRTQGGKQKKKRKSAAYSGAF